MANSVSSVKFYGDEYDLESKDLDRRRRMAEAIQAQGMRPDGNTEVINGWAIKRSPLEGAAKALQQGIGGYQQGKISEDEKALTRRYRTEEEQSNARFAAAIRGEQGPVDPGYVEQPMPGMEATPRPVMTAEQRQAAALEALGSHPNPQMRALPMQLQLAQLMKGPGEGFAKIDPSKFTPDSVKAFMGSGQRDYSLLQPLKPLHFADLGGGVQAVDPFTGLPKGEPMSKAVSPDAAARITEQQRQWQNPSAYQQGQLGIGQGNLAVNQGNLGLHNINTQFNTGQGLPGAPGPMVIPQGAPPPSPAPGMQPATPVQPPQPRLPGGGNPVMVVDPAVQRQRDAEAARLKAAEGQPGGGGLIPTGAVMQGAPAPAGKRPIVEMVTPKERQELLVKQPQAAAAATTSMQQIERLDQMANELKNHKGLSGITGRINQYSVLDALPATRDARGINDAMLNQVGIAALQAMRDASKTGGAVGNVTEKEWPILQQSIAALSNAQTTSAYRTALTNLRNQIKTSSERIKGAYEDTYGSLNYKPTPYKMQGRSEGDASMGGRDVLSQADAIIGGNR